MTDLLDITHAHMRAMIQSFGCLDAVAASINARWGSSVTKSTISKKLHGVLDWTQKDIVAIEDALGRYPVTGAQARRGRVGETGPSGNLVVLTGIVAKETGEAISACLIAQSSFEGGDRARAIVEIREAIRAMKHAEHRLLSEAS